MSKVAKFQVHSVGKERLTAFHKGNVNYISNDPVIKEKYADKIEKLKEKYNLSNTRKQDDASNDEVKETLQEIYGSLNKDEIKKAKKKSSSTSLLDITSSESSSQPNQYVKPSSTHGNPQNYYNPNRPKQAPNAVRVTLYNKGFERDNF